ncbi:DUF3306 domain-containing protein [Tepidamorphus sp. 3E244]|uniref:DUF3306 domain-containing protein n=1 Tax=Tepidamorphus sp. 3E244 TaxID=3385498 RepID=UPI0038FCD16D
MASEDNFLSRWSRLKRAPEPLPEEVEPEAEAASEPEEVPLDEEASEIATLHTDDPGAIADHGEAAPAAPHPAELIDIDSLDNASDFSAFVKKGVPAALQRQALRKLWTLDPVYGQLDGLNDYENMVECFGIADLAPGGSSWQVGRGFMTDEDFAQINERGGYGAREEEDEDAEDAETGEEDEDAEEELIAAEDGAEVEADDEVDGEDGEGEGDEDGDDARHVAQADESSEFDVDDDEDIV